MLANTGVKHETVADVLRVADGCIVGSSLKVDGNTWNAVDPERAAEFMRLVRAARSELSRWRVEQNGDPAQGSAAALTPDLMLIPGPQRLRGPRAPALSPRRSPRSASRRAPTGSAT